MRPFIGALAVLIGLLLCGGPFAARAADRLSGVVLMTPAAGSIVIHHESFGGMPAMTMTYQVPAGSRLRAGDRISADVDRSTDPWTLRAITVLGSEMPAQARREPAVLRVGDALPPGAFIDQHGHSVTLRSLHGTRFALTFMYTRCLDPKMCPLVSAKLHAVQRALPPNAKLVEVSLDPAFDRAPVLARYSAAYGAEPDRWLMLTGDPQRVLDFAARFGILEHAAGPVAIVHSERLAIVDANGRITSLLDGAAWSPADVRALLRDSR